jgi:hypothetical protein
VQIACIENVKGYNWVNANPSLIRLPAPFRAGQRCSFLIQIRDTKISVQMDGKTLIDWPTDYNDIGRNGNHGNNGRLGFFGGAWKVSTAEVVEYTGVGRKLREVPVGNEKFDAATEYSKLSNPTYWKSAENLIAFVDTKADIVKGSATREDQKLRLDPENAAGRIDIPYQPPAEYNCRVVFSCPDKRPAGTGGDLILVFPKNGKHYSLVLGGHGNLYSGIDAINGQNYRDNPTSIRTPDLLETGKRYTVLVAVRENHFTCWLNDKVLVDTQTDYAGWEMKAGMLPQRERTVLGLGAWTDAKNVHSFEVVDVKGKGTKLR